MQSDVRDTAIFKSLEARATAWYQPGQNAAVILPTSAHLRMRAGRRALPPFARHSKASHRAAFC